MLVRYLIKHDSFNWWNLLTSRFDEVFEIFLFFVDKNWHCRTFDSMRIVEKKMDKVEDKSDRLLLDTMEKTSYFALLTNKAIMFIYYVFEPSCLILL